MACTYFFYGHFIGLSETQVVLITLKQITNGILNALIATLVSLLVIKYLNKNIKISLRDIIFAIMITIVSFSLYISANIITKNKFNDIEDKIIHDLSEIGLHVSEELEGYVEHNVKEINHLIHDMHDIKNSHTKLNDIKYIFSVDKKNKITPIITYENTYNSSLISLEKKLYKNTYSIYKS